MSKGRPKKNIKHIKIITNWVGLIQERLGPCNNMKSFGSTDHSAVKAFDKLFLKPNEVFSYKTLNRKKPFLYNVGEREMGLEPYI